MSLFETKHYPMIRFELSFGMEILLDPKNDPAQEFFNCL